MENLGKKVKNCHCPNNYIFNYRWANATTCCDDLIKPYDLKDIYMLQISLNYHQSYLDMTVTSILEVVWTGHPCWLYYAVVLCLVYLSCLCLFASETDLSQGFDAGSPHLPWDHPFYDIARHQIIEVAGQFSMVWLLIWNCEGIMNCWNIIGNFLIQRTSLQREGEIC